MRPTDPEFAPGHEVKFADGFPVLVARLVGDAVPCVLTDKLCLDGRIVVLLSISCVYCHWTWLQSLLTYSAARLDLVANTCWA